MIREYIVAIPFAAVAIAVVAGALWLQTTYGPLPVVVGIVVVFATVIAFMSRKYRWKR